MIIVPGLWDATQMKSTGKPAEAPLIVLAAFSLVLAACTGPPDHRGSVKQSSAHTSGQSSAAKRSLSRQTPEQRSHAALPQATPAAANALVAPPDLAATSPGWVNVTPPMQSGGGIVAARPDTGPEPAAPAGNAGGLTAPPRTPAERAAVLAGAQRVEEARRRLARGEVLEARTLLEAALDAAPAAALHELGRTFDPYYLGQLPAINSGSEARRAAMLYQEAIVHGSATAGYDLDRLRATHPGLR